MLILDRRRKIESGDKRNEKEKKNIDIMKIMNGEYKSNRRQKGRIKNAWL